jgi:glycosyltransferase involved in cell wall biosynthesis
MAKILYCGDCAVQTGFGRVAENVLPMLSKEHEVVVLAVNWWGDPHDLPYRMYPAMPGGNDPFGTHRIVEVLQKEKPDMVLAVNDIWILNNLWNVAKRVKEELGFKWYGYFPVDSYGFFPDVFKECQEWDGMGTYTQFGLEEVRKAGCDMPCDVIPHGIERKDFFKMDKTACREEFKIDPDQFIVFNGNRNQPRKRIDITIRGFLKFAVDKPDAKLWLHMGAKDQGWDIIPLFKRMARDMGIDPTGRMILTSRQFDVTRCLPVDALNRAYNCADVGVNTCIGEGWGLVNFEHAATGVAQIVPDHTSMKEIFRGIPRIPVESWEVDCNYGLDRGQPSADGLADILNHYYEHRDDLQKVADWCHQMTQEDVCSWETIHSCRTAKTQAQAQN